MALNDLKQELHPRVQRLWERMLGFNPATQLKVEVPNGHIKEKFDDFIHVCEQDSNVENPEAKTAKEALARTIIRDCESFIEDGENIPLHQITKKDLTEILSMQEDARLMVGEVYRHAKSHGLELEPEPVAGAGTAGRGVEPEGKGIK